MSAPQSPNPEPAVDLAALPAEPSLPPEPTFKPQLPTLDDRLATAEDMPAPQVAEPSPAPAAPPAAAPAATAATQSALDSLAGAVLDAAELANRGAQAAASVSGELNRAIDHLREGHEKSQRQHVIALAGIGTVLFLALVFFIVTGVRMNSRINQLDATLLAVAKRAVALNTGLESLEAVNASIGQLAEQVTQVGKNTAEVGARLEQTMKQSEALGTQISTKTAEQVAAGSQGLARQVEGLNARLAAQAGSLQALNREIQALKGTAGSLDKLNRDVQSLVVLQRERAQEAVQRNTATVVKEKERERDRPVQYPRAQPQVSPNATATPPAAGGQIIVAPKGN